MSKRFADAQGGSARYGGPEAPDTPDDPPRKATAAQLAKRSIKPMKGRSAASSRSVSPSKGLPPPAMNPFGGIAAPQQQSQPQFNTNGFAALNSPAPQQQSGPQPPTASSFTFGAPQPASNPFGGMQQQSQSFPPPFSASQQPTTPTFSPAKTPSFNFGGPPAASTNGTAAPFAFGSSTPAKPTEANKTNGFGSSTTTANIFGAQAPKANGSSSSVLTDAEVKEIEDAAPRLAQAGKLQELEKMVRDNCAKYKNADSLAGFSPRELDEHAQRKMLDFVRNPGSTNSTDAFKKMTPDTPSSKPAFGSQPTAAPSFSFGGSTPAAPANPFSSLSRPSTPTASVSFGAPPSSSTTQTSGFSFTAPAPAASTPKPADKVSYPDLNGASSSQGDAVAPSPANIFSAKPAETPKPASAGLGQSMFGSTAPKTDSFTPFKIGETASSQFQQGSAPTPAPASTPFKLGAPAASSSAPKDSTPAPKPFQFGAPASTAPSAPAQSSTPAKPSFGGSFAPQAAPAPAASSASTHAAAKPPTFSATPSSGFKGFDAAKAPETSPAPSSFTAKVTPATEPASSGTTAPVLSASLSQKNRELNEAFKAHITSADPTQDWSNIMRHFLEEHKKITNSARVESIPDPTSKPAASRPSTSHGVSAQNSSVQAQASAAPSSNLANNKRKADEESGREDISKRSKSASDFSQSFSAAASSPNKPLSQTASLFDDILNTPPKQNTPAPQVPATAPAAPSFGNFTPAASKAAAPPAETPKANPFAKLTKVNNTPAAPPAATPKPAATGFSFTKSSTAAEPAKAAAAPAASTFQFKQPDASSNATASPFKITSSSTSTGSGSNNAGTSAAPAFQLPKFGAGSSTGTPNFLSAFGARAAEQEKKDKEKRKMEDYDSDEDDEAEWERKDAEEQAAKRKKMLEDAAAVSAPLFKPASAPAAGASGSVFTFGGAKTATPAPAASTTQSGGSANIFGHLSGKQGEKDDEEEESEDDADAEEDDAATTTPSKSLFDRVEKPANGDKPAAASTGVQFGGGSGSGSVFGNISSPKGDQTWNGESNTPIKFSSKPPTDSGSTTPSGSPAKAAFGGFSTTGAPAGTPKFGGFTASSIHDKAAPPKFNFGTSTSTSTSQAPFSNLFGAGSAKPVDTTKPASPAASGLNASIFSPSGSKTSTGFTFGTPNAGSGSKLSAPGPAGVFGTGSGTSSVFGNSTTPSRATTPATNTDAEASGSGKDENEPSDEPKDAQQGDLTSLTPDEAAANDVLFESKAKASQFMKVTPDAEKQSWVPKGLGVFRLLKNKETGKCHCTLRLVPSGRILLNFGLLAKNVPNAYVAHGKMARISISDAEGKLSTWTLLMRDTERVEEFVSKIDAERT